MIIEYMDMISYKNKNIFLLLKGAKIWFSKRSLDSAIFRVVHHNNSRRYCETRYFIILILAPDHRIFTIIS